MSSQKANLDILEKKKESTAQAMRGLTILLNFKEIIPEIKDIEGPKIFMKVKMSSTVVKQVWVLRKISEHLKR